MASPPRNSGPRGFGGNPEAWLLRRVGDRGPQGWAAPRGRCRGKRCSAPQGAVGLGSSLFLSSPSPVASVRAVSTCNSLPALCLYPLLVAALNWYVALEMKGPFRVWRLEPRVILLLTYLADLRNSANSALQAFSSVKWEA